MKSVIWKEEMVHILEYALASLRADHDRRYSIGDDIDESKSSRRITERKVNCTTVCGIVEMPEQPVESSQFQIPIIWELKIKVFDI
jgi:hypothetical protein